MKKTIKTKIITVLVIALAAAGALFFHSCEKTKKEIRDSIEEVKPSILDMRTSVSTTGTVAPKNRLEIMPSVAGRIESILVQEGNTVKSGQVLALMSSTERAALIDAARLQGTEAMNYWKNTYKPVQIVAPISGTVIVRDAEPGQTVNTSHAIIVISDRLIVKAQVDETDIGRVSVGQKAETTLDSHPDITVSGKVSHIYYESTTVSNVTIYYVEITPDRIPREFRSGMSATVEIIENEKKNTLSVPSEAVIKEGTSSYVMVKRDRPEPPEKMPVKTGLTDGSFTEITEGLSEDDTVLIFRNTSLIQESTGGKTNPFMPKRPQTKKKTGGSK